MTNAKNKPLRILSLGAGVQSTALFMLAIEGKIHVDAAIFADTEWEPKRVYAHLWKLATMAKFPVIIDTAGNLRSDAIRAGRSVSLPYYTKNADSTQGIARRQCTNDYKIAVTRRATRKLGGGPNKTDRRVQMLLGISWDEIQRMKSSDVAYIELEYPLIDLRWTRAECLHYLETRWNMTAPRSACIGCPFHGDSWWRNLQDDELDDVESFETTLQNTTQLDSVPYLHRSLQPIRTVVEQLRAQGTLFGADISNECGGSCHT